MATRIVKDNRDQVLRTIEQKSEASIEKAAEYTVREAQRDAPVDTGFLQNSISASKQGPLWFRVAVNASYGYWVEFGTTKMAARPFLIPAATKHAKNLVERLRRLNGAS